MTSQDPTPDIVCKAPAKLNLSLRVLGRRDDGFHELETLMVPLAGLHDVLGFSLSSGFEFTCDDASLPVDGGNLVVRAVRAFAREAGVSDAVRVHLEKCIPSGAGLGGGSSDAAATLKAMQALHGNPLDEAVLHRIAGELGSDVPFFLHGVPALCTGRGEIVTPAADVLSAPLPVLLLKPDFPVATVDAYRRLLESPAPCVPGIPMERQSINDIEISNDLERPVFAKHRFLAELKCWLLERPETRAALMSGSGSTVFAILNGESDGAAVVRAARHELAASLWSWCGQIRP